VTGLTGLTRNQKKKSKKCSRRRSRQAEALEMSASSSDVDNKCLMARINEMTKEDEFQVKVIKALTQELEMIKQEQDSLAQRYHVLSNYYANATNLSICVASLEKENQMLKAQVESHTSKHVALQGTHKELEYSYEKLVESHAMIEVAQEVVLTSVKSYQPWGGTHFLASTESNITSALGTWISLEAFRRNPPQPSELT